MASISPTGAACGAVVSDIDLREPVDDATAALLRSGLDDHHVLVLPDQQIDNEQLERFSTVFGSLGTDPWFVPIDGSDFIAEVRREAQETTPLFAEGWHSDWSFLETPPVATCLFGLQIPPVGGDTLFANQHLAYERLPEQLKARIDGLVGMHTTRKIYGKGGMYHEDNEAEAGRSMAFVQDGDPYDGEHPLVRVHEGNGRPALFSTIGYVQGIAGMDQAEARELLVELHTHQIADDVVYRHRWEPGMVVIWDNRSVLHRATGGYDGHTRVLRRTTIIPGNAAAA